MQRPSLDEIFGQPVSTVQPGSRPSLDQIFRQTSPAKAPEVGIGRTAFDQSMQGLTFGFGDEISDALGAFGAKVYSTAYDPELTAGKSLGDLYNEARASSSQRLASELEQSPGLSLASNIVGSVATGVPKAVLSSLRTGGLGARAVKSGSLGAASGALYGAGTADDGNRIEGAKAGALLGGGVGTALPVAGATAGAALRKTADALTPAIEEGLLPVVELAQKYKIPVSLSQVSSGNAIKNFQKVSKELPFSGENKFREDQMRAFNRELIKTVGGNANKFTPELMDNLFTKVGREFDDFGKGKVVNLNTGFAKQTEDLIMELEEVAPEAVGPALSRIKKIFSTADETGIIKGEQIAALRKETNRLARKTSNPDIASAFRDIENALIDSIMASDDAAGKAFSQTKQKYKNLLILEPLTNKSKGGNISPALLQNRVAKIYGRQFTRGKAGEIGDLARIGNELLPELSGSDTVPKAIIGGGVGTALLNPGLAVANAGKAATLLGANRLAQEFINRNPKMVERATTKTKLRITPADKKKLPRVELPQ